MKIRIRYVAAVAVVIATVLSISAYLSPAEGKYDSFAQCLADKGVTMYGAYWCPHCANQKQMFGSSFQYVKYVECDPKGENANPQLCLQNGVSGYPTWIYGQKRLEGEIPLDQLSKASGCDLPP